MRPPSARALLDEVIASCFEQTHDKRRKILEPGRAFAELADAGFEGQDGGVIGRGGNGSFHADLPSGSDFVGEPYGADRPC